MKRIILFIVALCINQTFVIHAMERSSVDVFFSDRDGRRQLTLVDYSNSNQKLTAVYHIDNLEDESFTSLPPEKNPLVTLKNEYGFEINPGNGQISLLDTFDPNLCVIRTNTIIHKSNVRLYPKYKIDITRVIGLDTTYKNILRPRRAIEGSAVGKTFNQHFRKSMSSEEPFTVDFFSSNSSTLADLERVQDPLLEHIIKATTALLLIEQGYELLNFPAPYQIFVNGDLKEADFPDCFIVESRYCSVPVPVSAEERMKDVLSEEKIHEALRQAVKNDDPIIAQNAQKVLDFIKQTEGSTFKLFHQMGINGISQAWVEELNSDRFLQAEESSGAKSGSNSSSSASSSLSASPTKEDEKDA